MTDPVYAIDFETYYDSDYSLKTLGPDAYCWHPLFQAYMVSIAGSDGLEYVGPVLEAPWPAIAGHQWVSHNARFDETVFLQLCRQYPFLDAHGPSVWDCTADLSCWSHGPRSLADAARAFLDILVDKDPRTKARGRKAQDLATDPEMQAYAIKDARICLLLWGKLSPDWPEAERRISRLTRLAGRRGIAVDLEALIKGIHLAEKARFDAEANIPWADTHPVLSHAAVRSYCRNVGIPCPSSLAEDSEDCAEWESRYGVEHPVVAEMRRWRKTNTLLRKLKAIALRVHPETRRMAFCLKYFGAHTGRFSGDAGVNMQNLPRDPFEISPQDFVDMRGLFIAPPNRSLACVDQSQIEARVLLWLVGDEDTLDKVRSGMSVYEAHARATMGWTGGVLEEENKSLYRLAKARVLGLGYGCGHLKFVALARIYGIELTEDESLKAVRDFRASNPRITAYWNKFQTQLLWAARQQESLTVRLKSGRVLLYRDLRLEKKQDRPVPRFEVTGCMGYDDQRMRLYGGLLTENVVQATARDVFMDRYLALEDAGYSSLFHVHDEYVIEVGCEKDLRTITEIATIPPAWAKGLPLGVKGQLSPRYLK